MKRYLILAVWGVAVLWTNYAGERQYLWPEGKMPDVDSTQVAVPITIQRQSDYNPDDWRKPYLEWHEAPAAENKKDLCMILISGGAYQVWCDVAMLEGWRKDLTARGVQCVSLVYRTPRPKQGEIYRTAWEDGQRAVRLVRAEAAKRGFKRVGTMSMSAGSHLATLLATSSLTPAYTPIDALDRTPCSIDFAVAFAIAYGVTDGLTGANVRRGQAGNAQLDDIFRFDAKTCPMCLLHGGADCFSPMSSTRVYRKLREKGVPAEIHLYPDKEHNAWGYDRAVEFMTQMGYLGEVQPEVEVLSRYASDDARASVERVALWPKGRTPEPQAGQGEPYLEWHTPKAVKTGAILLAYSGGGYNANDPENFEVAPVRRYLNEKGMTVVTLKYRTPRPPRSSGLAKHTSAWQDLQRAIRLVRTDAARRGLDPDRIGIMGSSAGGHLTLMGVTSSKLPAYGALDEIDKKTSCRANWAVAVYPAYVLTDGPDGWNTNGGNTASDRLVEDFTFDPSTCPTLFLHGDADGYAAMGSVKCWEQMRRMGIQSEVHTLATRSHCFQRTASPGTGSYTWIDRIWEFLDAKKIISDYSTSAGEPGDATDLAK